MTKLPWNGPLFPVRGHLADRYTEALKEAVGLEAPLKEFSVDRMGWSPQLAGSLGEDYMSHEAMRHGIILSPDQATAPLLRRRFSYEAILINKVYLEARPTLLHLIEYEPVLVEIDSGQAFCRSVGDVLAIKNVEACLSTPTDTLGKTRRLLELAEKLKQEGRLLDDSFIEQMLKLVRQVGDPRKRPLPPAFQVTIGSLWAEVAGPIYLLRAMSAQQKPLAITTRPEQVPADLPVTALELGPQLVDALHEAGFLRYTLTETFLRKRLGELEREALLAAGEPRPASDDTARRRQLARNAQAHAALPQTYWELDAELKRLAAGSQISPQRLSLESRWALSAPARDAEIMGHLIARFVRYDYQALVYHHRRIVQAEWGRYSEAKRDYLQEHFPHLTASFIGLPPAAPAAPAPAPGASTAGGGSGAPSS